MKNIKTKIILSAILILSYPGKMLGSSPPVPIEPIAGDVPTPQTTIITLADRVLHLIFLPLGLLAVLFYSIYFLFKKEKKQYLYLANIFLIMLAVTLLAWLVFDWLGETNHFGIFN